MTPKTQPNKSKTIFDWLNEITYKKSLWSSFTEHDIKEFNAYMIHRFVSMYRPYIHIANAAQIFQHSEKEKIYKFYCEMLPKNKIYAKYIKGNTKSQPEKKINEIVQEYHCSVREAKEYIEILK